MTATISGSADSWTVRYAGRQVSGFTTRAHAERFVAAMGWPLPEGKEG